MFKDTKEGQTHHDKDACYKCRECSGHYQTENYLHQHLSESVQCSDLDIINLKSMNGGHGPLGNFCNHLMVDTGKYERQCKFCNLTELRDK